MGGAMQSARDLARREVLQKVAVAGVVAWTAPVIVSTPAAASSKTVCGSVRFTTLKKIKWHFFGSGGGQRTSSAREQQDGDGLHLHRHRLHARHRPRRGSQQLEHVHL